jgi:hypothetical protein
MLAVVLTPRHHAKMFEENKKVMKDSFHREIGKMKAINKIEGR